MMNEYINGYMVVRLPHLNNRVGPKYVNAPQLDGIYYGGIERMPWDDLAYEFYNGKLPESIEQHWLSLKKNNIDFPGISLVQDLKIALDLLEYCNREKTRNELIAIRSKELIDYKGAVPTDSQSISWIGYDLVAWPEWSLLNAGIFIAPSAFIPWKKHVNVDGLFDTLHFADEYAQAYYQASLDNIVEEVWRLDLLAHVEVGRLNE